MKIDPSKYDYVMYVDASGDDGFKFEKDSSICYCAAALLVRQKDIPHNLAILGQIKKIVGCKTTDEVKYSKVRRNKRGPEALELLKDIKGRMSCYIVFKKELSQEEIPQKGSKSLSVTCHAMALDCMNYFEFAANEKILIVIDRMKHTEEEPLGNIISDRLFNAPKQPNSNFSYDVLFRDSKDSSYLLIQVADLLCGIVREHFEQYESNKNMLYFKNICPKCFSLQLAKKSHTRSVCTHGGSRAANIMQSKNLHYIFHLLPALSGFSKISYFFMRPSKMMYQHFYLFCEKI